MFCFSQIIGFHLSHRLTEKFPESCLLIILGLIVGALLYVTHLAEQKAYVLNSDTFFLFLLPVSTYSFFLKDSSQQNQKHITCLRINYRISFCQ